MAPDPWLSAYDATYSLTQEIAEKIHERNRYLRNGESPVKDSPCRLLLQLCSLLPYTLVLLIRIARSGTSPGWISFPYTLNGKLNVILRSLMQNLRGKIDQLKDSLLRSISTRQITQLEGDRRQNLVDELLTKERQLQTSFKSEGTEPDVVRSSLMIGGAGNGSRQNPWLLEEPEETRGLGFGEIRQQQHRIIAEQDAGLDALSSIIARQKQMGHDIGNELEEQNEIIDDLTNLVENTDVKIRTQTRNVKLVDKKSGSCAMLVVIVLLLIAIVVVAVWPTK